VADILSVHEEPVLLASPWLTVEEGAGLRALGELLGRPCAFVSPPPSPLRDELLHTGDPCPNRRGLSELGFEALAADAALERLRGAESALLVGERIGELLGAGELAGLPPALRLVVLDTHPLGVPAVALEIGVPDAAERTGTWVNVDGVRGSLSAARPAPAGVPPLARTLEEIERHLAARSAEARSG
jgi:hypothetical protein